MLSIFILYSSDRYDELMITLESLKRCDKFNKCQVIVCTDGNNDLNLEEVEILNVERKTGLFCWGDVWEECIKSCVYDKILYMDCDRILPSNGISNFIDSIKDNDFCFPRLLYSLTKKLKYDQIIRIYDNFSQHRNLLKDDHRIWSSAWNSVRHKNPISGCTGFTKKTYERSGGIDKNYVGWGYPDTDFFQNISNLRMRVSPLEMTELHLHHKYSVPLKEVKMMNLWNGVRFCNKWGFGIHPNISKLSQELDISISVVQRYTLENFLNMKKIKLI